MVLRFVSLRCHKPFMVLTASSLREQISEIFLSLLVEVLFEQTEVEIHVKEPLE